MSCNGNNHRPGCNCGWGGIFYGLGIGLEDNYWYRSENYTNPNARCPRCYAWVYFYRSPDGGSVYFDDLGPPWPKHPCMDAGKKSLLPGIIRNVLERPLWATEGWHPMQCDSIEIHKVYTDVIVFISGEGRDRREIFATNKLAKISQYSPVLWRRFEGQRGHYEISTLDLSDPKFKEVRFEAFDKVENIKIKDFDVCMAMLKGKLIKEIREYDLEINFDDEILKFRRLLLDHGDLEESIQRATASLNSIVKKSIKLRGAANLAQSIYDELVAEGKRLEKDYAKFDIDLRPGLRMARKKAVVQGLSLKVGKVMLRDVAKRIIEKEVEARDREILVRKIDSSLFDEGLRIEKEFEEFSVDLRKNLKIVRKKAISKGLSLEEGKSLMRECAKVFLDDKFRSQQKEEKIKEIRNFIDDICLTSEEFNEKGRSLLESALEDIINSDDEIDVLSMRGHLLNIAKLYLEKVAEAWDLQKSNKKFEGRARKSDLVIFSKDGTSEARFDKNKHQIFRTPFNSVLADKLRLALDKSGNK